MSEMTEIGRKVLLIGTRSSELALKQTAIIVKALKQAYPEVTMEIVTMKTLGDKILDKPLANIGEKSLFTRELEAALEGGHVDLVVHSLKDLPVTSLSDYMLVSAIYKRGNPYDAVVMGAKHEGKNSEHPPSGVCRWDLLHSAHCPDQEELPPAGVPQHARTNQLPPQETRL